MYPVSSKFTAAVSGGSYTFALKVEHLDPTLMSVLDVLTTQVISGAVTVQTKQEGRRTLSMVVENPAGIWTPRQSTDPFALNQVLRVWRGVAFQDGTTEYAPLGTFLVNRPWVEYTQTALQITVDAMDFWKRLQYGAFTTVATYAAGSSVKAAIVDILGRAGITQYSIDPAIAALNFAAAPSADLNFLRGTAYADALGALMQDFGLDFWFDPLGVFIARPQVDPTTISPTFTLNEADPLVDKVSGGYEDSPDIKNHIGVASTNPDVAPIYQEAKDNDQNSLTYVNGPLGDRFFEYDGDWIQTAQQATDTAKNILKRRVWASRKTEWQHGPRPELDAYDVGTLISPTVAIPAPGKPYYVDAMTIPLTNAQQTTTLLEPRALG